MGEADRSAAHRHLLFRWTDELHIRARGYDELVWKPALAAVGVIPKPTKDASGRRRYDTDRKSGMHAPRHWYASVTLADGASIRDLAEWMGHADPAFTLRVYAHFMPSSHDRARKAIDARMFKPRAVASGSDGQGRSRTDDDHHPAPGAESDRRHRFGPQPAADLTL